MRLIDMKANHIVPFI